MASTRLVRISAAAMVMLAAGCGTSSGEGGGTGGTAGLSSSATQPGSGGRPGSGGANGTGGANGSGGHDGSGGAPGTGGAQGVGGTPGTGGAPGSGGQSGAVGTGGSPGRDAGRDLPGSAGGLAGAGGAGGAAGSSADSGTTVEINCSATMPSGGQSHSGNSMGGSGNLAWQIWSNQGTGSMVTFSTPAFSAAWNNSGDYLGRIGYEWGNGGKTYDKYGTITADFTFKKTGTAGGFSYIGIYGWSVNPCTEWYIVDDSFGNMPFTPWSSSAKGTPAVIDGETYKFYANSTNGTGGSRCNASSWMQFWSIRQKARQCGRITISEHFKAWDAAGMKLGNLLEAKILVETGGGSGTVDFPIAKVLTQ